MGFFSSIGSVFSAPIKAVGGLLGGGDSGAPSYDQQQAMLDSQTNAQINNYADRMKRTTDDLTADALQGVEKGNLIESPQEMERKQASLGGASNPAMNEALQKRALKAFDSDAVKTRRNTELKSRQDRMNNLAAGQKALFAREEANIGLAKRRLDEELGRRQARSDLIGGVISSAGSMAGMAFGGPQGAQVGGAVAGAGRGKPGMGSTLA